MSVKNIRKEQVIIIAACLLAGVTLLAMPQFAFAAGPGSSIANLFARGIKYACNFSGVLLAIYGIYEIFKGFVDGGPSMTKGVQFVVAGVVLLAVANSGLIEGIVGQIGSF